MPPSLANGKVCYLELPADDAAAAAAFYERVFGWIIRRRADGGIAFEDTTGEVGGGWVIGRRPAEPGLLVYVMVDSVATTLQLAIANGGQVVQEIGADAPDITARLRDPSGNVIGLYEEPGRESHVEHGGSD